jgi:hypothetical protein
MFKFFIDFLETEPILDHGVAALQNPMETFALFIASFLSTLVPEKQET